MINHATHNTKKDTTFDTFHFVKGNKMFGILIDPGAAKGLIGSDTLNELINNVLKPAKMDKYIKWRTSTNKAFQPIHNSPLEWYNSPSD